MSSFHGQVLGDVGRELEPEGGRLCRQSRVVERGESWWGRALRGASLSEEVGTESGFQWL